MQTVYAHALKKHFELWLSACRDGMVMLLITDGTLGAPIREFTIASTLQRMLLDVVEVGGDVDWLPMSAAGVSLVIADLTLSGE